MRLTIGVVFLFKRFFLSVSLFLMALMLFAPEAFAARALELNDLQYQVVEEDGRSVLRIEIGMSRADVSYTVQKDSAKPKHLIVAVQDAKLGAMRTDATLDGALGRFMTLREAGRRGVEIMVSFASEVEDQNYAVYTLPADRSAKKPDRLVIDVMTPVALPVPAFVAPDGIEGVAGHTIVLDPGHGGSDTGAIGPTGVTEKSIALRIAKRLKVLLEAEGAEVILTRTEDTEVSPKKAQATDVEELQARCDIANQNSADIFLSIHLDAFSGPEAHGTTGYYYEMGSADSTRLADCVKRGVLRRLGTLDRGTKPCAFYVCRHTDMPAMLLETAFVSNPREEQMMNSEEGVENAAQGIAAGIAEYFQ